jgi:hypothetical protein
MQETAACTLDDPCSRSHAGDSAGLLHEEEGRSYQGVVVASVHPWEGLDLEVDPVHRTLGPSLYSYQH